MKKLNNLIIGVLLVALILVFAMKNVMAQDAVKVAPNVYKVLLENDRVRVLEIRMKPGEKSPMHSHPANVFYILNGGKGKMTLPDGKAMEMEFKAGDVGWFEETMHAVENIGTTEVQAIAVELKKPVSNDPVKVSSKVYKVLLGGERVRVLEARLKPGEKSPMHSHPAYAAYILSGGKAKFTLADGKTQEIDAKAGDVIWSEAVAHAVENMGTTEVHVIVFELKN